MKGSPIISTITACAIMLGMYLCMQFSLADAPEPELGDNQDEEVDRDSELMNAEIYFSTPPKSLTLRDPLTQKPVIELTDLTETEWSGEITIPKYTESLELIVDAKWENHSGLHFIEIQLYSDEREASATLKGETDIEDTANFKWDFL